jgi:hypothetical protein
MHDDEVRASSISLGRRALSDGRPLSLTWEGRETIPMGPPKSSYLGVTPV